jgi:hypothetical protein
MCHAGIEPCTSNTNWTQGDTYLRLRLLYPPYNIRSLIPKPYTQELNVFPFSLHFAIIYKHIYIYICTYRNISSPCSVLRQLLHLPLTVRLTSNPGFSPRSFGFSPGRLLLKFLVDEQLEQVSAPLSSVFSPPLLLLIYHCPLIYAVALIRQHCHVVISDTVVSWRKLISVFVVFRNLSVGIYRVNNYCFVGRR